MKFERLTEDKIRVIVKPDDLDLEELDISAIMDRTPAYQSFFINMLEQAKYEVGFDAEGCKILIEAFTSDENIVFTITKCSDRIGSKTTNKKLTVKRKTLNSSAKHFIYKFNKFDDFCDFCEGVKSFNLLASDKISRFSCLYLYNDTYYLVIRNKNIDESSFKKFAIASSEFAPVLNSSDSFLNKLLEHGKAIIRKDAINAGTDLIA